MNALLTQDCESLKVPSFLFPVSVREKMNYLDNNPGSVLYTIDGIRNEIHTIQEYGRGMSELLDETYVLHEKVLRKKIEDKLDYIGKHPYNSLGLFKDMKPDFVLAKQEGFDFMDLKEKTFLLYKKILKRDILTKITHFEKYPDSLYLSRESVITSITIAMEMNVCFSDEEWLEISNFFDNL